jgi:hypothetical protein
MEYEGSIGFVMRKMKIFIADFHVLGLFMAKKHDLKIFEILVPKGSHLREVFAVLLFRP